MRKFFVVFCLFVIIATTATEAKAQYRHHRGQVQVNGNTVAIASVALGVGLLNSLATHSDAVKIAKINADRDVEVAKARAEASKPQVINVPAGNKVVVVNGNQQATKKVVRKVVVSGGCYQPQVLVSRPGCYSVTRVYCPR